MDYSSLHPTRVSMDCAYSIAMGAFGVWKALSSHMDGMVLVYAKCLQDQSHLPIMLPE